MNESFIPGLMPLSENARETVFMEPRGGLRAYIHQDSINNPVANIAWKINSITDHTLLSGDNDKIFTTLRDDRRLYFLVTDNTCDFLPRNTVTLDVLINGQDLKKFYVRADRVLFDERPHPQRCVPFYDSQTSQIYLNQTDLMFAVKYPIEFITPPMIVVPKVIADMSADPVLSINADVMGIDKRKFTVRLSVLPNTGGYRLAWAAWI